MSEPLRIANCSGFYGDRLSAAREMVEGGPIDVLSGDYLAELTLAILLKDRLRDPDLGYAKTFLHQLGEVADTCVRRGIKIVVNAGGLNPAGLARASRALYAKLGIRAVVAHIEGDDVLPVLDKLQAEGELLAHLDKGIPLSALDARILSANAYLGGMGIAQALDRGADLVVCPRVTDASLVVGPAVWRFGWAHDDWDCLASAVVAGHVIECGTQCTGGNYAFFDEVPRLARPGFPIAELYEDGSFAVTKHPGTEGTVSAGTVTAQLLYEIAGPGYANPDATARFDTIQLCEEGPDRVRVSGVRGAPPPARAKVCINHDGGFRNSVTFAITGLGVEAKARLAEETLWDLVGGRHRFAETHVSLHRADRPDPGSNEEAVAHLTLSVRDPDPEKVGRAFANKAVEMALANYPGCFLTAPPGRGTRVAVFWPTLIPSQVVEQRVVIDGESVSVATLPPPAGGVDAPPAPLEVPGSPPGGPTRDVPLGRLCGARSGDKGGNANLGVWVRSDEAYRWLVDFLSVERFLSLVVEARGLAVERHAFPNLRALNFVVTGLLGDGVAASLRGDPQAKGLGEYLRAKVVPVPAALLDD